MAASLALPAGNAVAVSNPSAVPDDQTAGATTGYTFSFEPNRTLDAAGSFPDEIVVLTQAGGPDVFKATSRPSACA